METTVVLPSITPLTQAWWDACKQGRLLLPHCNACGKEFFRPEVACTHCFAVNWKWVEASGRGTLYSYSVIHRPPLPGFKTPLVFAIVELAEGPAMFSNVVGCAPDEVRIGMPLQVVFEALNAEVSLPKFRPVDS